MILARIPILKMLIPDRRAAAAYAARWSRASAKDPELAADIIRLGGVLDKQAEEYRDGVVVPNPIDPIRMAKEAGRREFAVELLALMQITPEELRNLTEYDT